MSVGPSSSTSSALFATLIRTHHITSRKKLTRVRQAAARHQVPFVLVRSSGFPGLMYAEANDQRAVTAWVSAVKALRYKGFQCVHKPAAVTAPEGASIEQINLNKDGRDDGFEEVTTVAEFGRWMDQRGLGRWWREGMGFAVGD